MYGLMRKVLFTAPPEVAHEMALESLRLGHALGADRLLCARERLPVSVMGIEFPNPVGLAAGISLTLFGKQTALPATVSTIFMFVYVIWLTIRLRKGTGS